MKKYLLAASLLATSFSAITNAADYVVDYAGAHASINFKVQHLGYSWLTGRFDKFEGKFSYDAKDVSASKIELTIDTTSINTNHAEREKHLRSADFLEVNKFASATFVSSSVAEKADGKLEIKGALTMHGISKEITIDAIKIGEGKDPWGGYRAGFSGTTEITMKDFGIKMDLGPASAKVFFDLHIEGVKQ
ncbi:MAG: YceI family protein [Kangiellaceae bacterium]|nr:YceI family protein [Kangiellaceae bacterium]